MPFVTSSECFDPLKRAQALLKAVSISPIQDQAPLSSTCRSLRFSFSSCRGQAGGFSRTTGFPPEIASFAMLTSLPAFGPSRTGPGTPRRPARVHCSSAAEARGLRRFPAYPLSCTDPTSSPMLAILCLSR